MVRHKRNQAMRKVCSLITKHNIFKCHKQKYVHEANKTVAKCISWLVTLDPCYWYFTCSFTYLRLRPAVFPSYTLEHNKMTVLSLTTYKHLIYILPTEYWADKTIHKSCKWKNENCTSVLCCYILTCIMWASRIVGFHLGMLSALLNTSCSNWCAGKLIVPCNQRTNIFNSRTALTLSHPVKIQSSKFSCKHHLPSLVIFTYTTGTASTAGYQWSVFTLHTSHKCFALLFKVS